MSKRTKADLESAAAALTEALDAIRDALEDDQLTSTRKVTAALEELDRLEARQPDNRGTGVEAVRRAF